MLCLALGIPSPRHLRQVLTYADLVGWSRYYDVQPFGHLREDFRSAIVAYAAASASGQKNLTLRNFIFETPKARKQRLDAEEQTDEEIKSAMMQWQRRLENSRQS